MASQHAGERVHVPVVQDGIDGYDEAERGIGEEKDIAFHRRAVMEGAEHECKGSSAMYKAHLNARR